MRNVLHSQGLQPRGNTYKRRDFIMPLTRDLVQRSRHKRGRRNVEIIAQATPLQQGSTPTLDVAVWVGASSRFK